MQWILKPWAKISLSFKLIFLRYFVTVETWLIHLTSFTFFGLCRMKSCYWAVSEDTFFRGRDVDVGVSTLLGALVPVKWASPEDRSWNLWHLCVEWIWNGPWEHPDWWLLPSILLRSPGYLADCSLLLRTQSCWRFRTMSGCHCSRKGKKQHRERIKILPRYSEGTQPQSQVTCKPPCTHVSFQPLNTFWTQVLYAIRDCEPVAFNRPITVATRQGQGHIQSLYFLLAGSSEPCPSRITFHYCCWGCS